MVAKKNFCVSQTTVEKIFETYLGNITLFNYLIIKYWALIIMAFVKKDCA